MDDSNMDSQQLECISVRAFERAPNLKTSQHTLATYNKKCQGSLSKLVISPVCIFHRS